jgi:hypothetical protein
MVQVMKAEWKRTAEREGKDVSEVEVWVAEEEKPLKVYIEQEAGGYHIHQILRNDADYDLDWYDNDMHKAFQDVSGEVVPVEEQASFAQTVAELARL